MATMTTNLKTLRTRAEKATQELRAAAKQYRMVFTERTVGRGSDEELGEAFSLKSATEAAREMAVRAYVAAGGSAEDITPADDETPCGHAGEAAGWQAYRALIDDLDEAQSRRWFALEDFQTWQARVQDAWRGCEGEETAEREAAHALIISRLQTGIDGILKAHGTDNLADSLPA
jgi:hypothetical protein